MIWMIVSHEEKILFPPSEFDICHRVCYIYQYSTYKHCPDKLGKKLIIKVLITEKSNDRK